MTNANTAVLRGGVSVPRLGYGVWQVPADLSPGLVAHALQTGYRLIDTAEAYYNEDGVGAGLRDSGVHRSEIFVTSKIWNTHHGYDRTLRAFDDSLKRLELDYLDLYLIHWPSRMRNAFVPTWRALVRLLEEGRVRAIGVCNFAIPQLRRLITETGVAPAINQVELHPYFQQRALRQFHEEHGIITQSWSPLGLWKNRISPMTDTVIRDLAYKHGRTPAQIILNWHLRSELLVVSKSERRERIAENFDALQFNLSDEDCARIARLDRPDGRLGPDPEHADF